MWRSPWPSLFPYTTLIRSIGPLLIWQQPHPISYAELCYQTHRDRPTLERYGEIVFETADFMASFAFFEDRKSTRLNSSHEWISYALFCLKKKRKPRRLALA